MRGASDPRPRGRQDRRRGCCGRGRVQTSRPRGVQGQVVGGAARVAQDRQPIGAQIEIRSGSACPGRKRSGPARSTACSPSPSQPTQPAARHSAGRARGAADPTGSSAGSQHLPSGRSFPRRDRRSARSAEAPASSSPAAERSAKRLPSCGPIRGRRPVVRQARRRRRAGGGGGAFGQEARAAAASRPPVQPGENNKRIAEKPQIAGGDLGKAAIRSDQAAGQAERAVPPRRHRPAPARARWPPRPPLRSRGGCCPAPGRRRVWPRCAGRAATAAPPCPAWAGCGPDRAGRGQAADAARAARLLPAGPGRAEKGRIGAGTSAAEAPRRGRDGLLPGCRRCSAASSGMASSRWRSHTGRMSPAARESRSSPCTPAGNGPCQSGGSGWQGGGQALARAQRAGAVRGGGGSGRKKGPAGGGAAASRARAERQGKAMPQPPCHRPRPEAQGGVGDQRHVAERRHAARLGSTAARGTVPAAAGVARRAAAKRWRGAAGASCRRGYPRLPAAAAGGAAERPRRSGGCGCCALRAAGWSGPLLLPVRPTARRRCAKACRRPPPGSARRTGSPARRGAATAASPP